MPKFPVKNLIPVRPEMQLKYRDIFDLKQFYDALHEWLNEYGWTDVEDNTEHYETHYGENINGKGIREIWIRWRPHKAAPHIGTFNNNKDPALVYYLDFNWHAIGITPTEVVKEGKKFKVHKGEIELKVAAYIEERYKSEFDKNKFLKEFKSLFFKRIYKKALAQRKKELYQELYEMNNFIKQWFKLKRYLPYDETKNYFRSYAWPSHVKDKQQ